MARLRRKGFALVKCTGDHRKFVKDGMVVIVPGQPGKHLKPSTWKSIKIQAGW